MIFAYGGFVCSTITDMPIWSKSYFATRSINYIVVEFISASKFIADNSVHCTQTFREKLSQLMN